MFFFVVKQDDSLTTELMILYRNLERNTSRSLEDKFCPVLPKAFVVNIVVGIESDACHAIHGSPMQFLRGDILADE